MTKAAPRVTKAVTSKKKARAVTEKKHGTRRGAVTAAEHRRLFIEAFIANGGNGTQAAITAGYAASRAKQQAFRLMKMQDVKDALRERQDKLARKHELTTESVIAELSKIVHADPRRMFADNGTILPVKDWPDDVAGMVASVEVDELFDGTGKDRTWTGYTKKVKLWDKNSAIEKAMKHLGLFAEDNKQRAGALADLPRPMVKAIIERLQQMNREHGGNGAPPRLA